MATPTAFLAMDEARTGPFGPSTNGATEDLRHDTSCINRAVDGRIYSQRRPPRGDQRGPMEERAASAGGDAPFSRQHYPSAQANLASQIPQTLPHNSMWGDPSMQTGPHGVGEFRMMYALDADGNIAQDSYPLAPVFVHNGHSVVPYYAWDLSGGGAPGYPPHPEGANRGRQSNGGRNNNNNSYRNKQQRQQAHQQQQQRRRNQPKHGTALRKSDSEQEPVHSQSGMMRSSSSAGSLASNEAAIRMAAMTALAGARGDSSIYARCISAPASPSTNAVQLGGLYNPTSNVCGGGAGGGGGVPSVVDAGDDAPDLERFLRVSTPTISRPDSLEGMASLQLSALWQCFEHSSAYGLECPTLGGPRGPSNCYFVPFLSAVQLYAPASEGGEDESGTFVYPQGLDSWPSAMHKCFEWSAADHVAERLPVSQRIQELCQEQGDDHPVMSSRILDLHPYSWFAVAWYPLYRIPEAPLTARFLTFHSLAPLWEAASQAEMQLQRQSTLEATATAAAGSASYKLMLAGGALNHPAAATGPSANGPSATATSGSMPMHSRRPSNGVPATPTGITSFPGSPLSASDVTRTATSTTMSGSRSHSVASAPATASDSASVTASFGSSVPPSPAGSDNGDERQLPLSAGCYDTLAAQSASLEIPAVGLCWHTTAPSSSHGRNGADNWTDTLVAVDLPSQIGGRGLRPGDALPGPTNARVVGVWPGTAVIRKDYPLAKGGPLSWEIQLEELEEGARRLALSLGLVKAEAVSRSTSGDVDAVNTAGSESLTAELLPVETDLTPVESESCCPDFDFFWARKR